MNKQQQPRQLSDTLFARSSTPGTTGNSTPLGGNNNNQDRLLFINDLQAWLAIQADVIDGLQGDSRNQRVNGVLWVVTRTTEAYQQGASVDVSALPMSPTSAQAPAMHWVMPGLAGALQPFTNAVQIESDGFLIASAEGGFGRPKKVPESPAAAESAAQQASTASGAPSKEIIALAAQVMALRLKMPDEDRTFLLSKYGDSASAVKILQHCVQVGIKSPDQVAYILSTVWTESRMGDWMTESAWLSEKSAERYAEQSYGPNGNNPARAKRMGNTNSGDGGRYMGRGYVQLTWKNNYKRMSKILTKNGFSYTQDGVTYGKGNKPIDLVKNYNHVNRNKDLAARILVLGMDGGHYVNNGKGLDSYIPEGKQASQGNFESARQIVNGRDKKRLIAENAMTIAAVRRKNDAWSKAFSSRGSKPSKPPGRKGGRGKPGPRPR